LPEAVWMGRGRRYQPRSNTAPYLPAAAYSRLAHSDCFRLGACWRRAAGGFKLVAVPSRS
jgi:hypothetical protein